MINDIFFMKKDIQYINIKEHQPATAEENNVQASKSDQANEVQSAVPRDRERRFFSALRRLGCFRPRTRQTPFMRGYWKGRSVGYKRGLSVGQSRGYKSGFAAGKSRGYAAGTAAEKQKLSGKIWSVYSRGYALGKRHGYSRGYKYGKSVGYRSGYSNGYKVGKRTGYRSGHSVGYRKGRLMRGRRCSYTRGLWRRYLSGYPKSLGRKQYT